MSSKTSNVIEKIIEIKLRQVAPKACSSILNAISKLERYEALGIDVSSIKERLLNLAKQLKCIEDTGKRGET